VDKIENMEVFAIDRENQERQRVLALLDLNPQVDELRRFVLQGVSVADAALELRKKEKRSIEDPGVSALSPFVTFEKKEADEILTLARKFGAI
jgi:hypothetical protein